MTVKIDIIVLFFAMMALSCQTIQGTQDDETQGVEGKIVWLEGNMMPGPGVDLPDGDPIEREILFYKPTSDEEVTGNGPLYDAVHSELVARTISDENGNFKVELPAGKYSVFVVEDGQYYASTMDSYHFNPVQVEKGKLTQMKIRVDYKAYY